ncbi:MAG TPA: hypothetical protein VJR02_08695 [Pyrinomonadaceae bacterium]|nr:hypothetical protein [Pyrinomonadaceae bacterium]
MPSEIRAVFTALQDEVFWLHAKWNIHRQLFGTSEERIDLLNDFGPDLFQIIYDSLLHDVLLTMSRLTDPATSFKKENLTLSRLTNMIEETDYKDLLTEIRALQTKTDEHCEPFRRMRNRVIAHNDLAAALSHHHDPLPDITRQMIDNGLSSIRDYMSAIDTFFDATETDYKQPHLRGDGDSLIHYLEEVRAYHQHRLTKE